MSTIKVEDIIAYRIDGETVCVEHATQEEMDAADQDDMILESDRNDEEIIFCDRGKEKI